VNRPPDALRALVESGDARRLRQAAQISLATMATALGTSQGGMSLLERGLWQPSASRGRSWLRILQGLARHLEVPR
jgi:transcriptional regulator with XRE-family HTH domain